MRRVLVTGITGFAGSHLVDFMLAKGGVEVLGILRWRSRTDNIEHFRSRVTLLECDLRDSTSTRDALESARPDWIFHLAAQSFVPTSWNAPHESISTNALGQLNLFEAVRRIGIRPRIQIAGSSEEYGLVHDDELPIRETNPLRPLSPYAVSKVTQDLLGYQYFKSYGMDVVRTRGFNHEGPRRPNVFVASDFAWQISEVEKGRREPVIHVGNLEARRDFTDVRDMVEAYWLLHPPGPRSPARHDQGQDRGARRSQALAALRRSGAARRQHEVPQGHRLGAAHSVRADAGRHARFLAGAESVRADPCGSW